eukprot:1096628-Prymnesium_polylepis.1
MCLHRLGCGLVPRLRHAQRSLRLAVACDGRAKRCRDAPIRLSPARSHVGRVGVLRLDLGAKRLRLHARLHLLGE